MEPMTFPPAHTRLKSAPQRALLFSCLAGVVLFVGGCAPIEVSMDARSLAWLVLFCLAVILIQLVVMGAMVARHPKTCRYLKRAGLPSYPLEKTRHQLYREIARHESTEELLRETQEYLHCIINSIPSVLIGITPDGQVTHWNSAAEKTTGVPASEAVGGHISQICPALPVDMETIRLVIQSGSTYTQENVQQGKGTHATFTDIRVCPLLSGKVSGAVILADDVTLRVRLESMMVQNEKMMSLGEMAAGLAHEINNPLAGILNNIQNIQRRTSRGLAANEGAARDAGVTLEQVETYLKKRQIPDFIANIQEAGERAAHIVKNMLEFSRNQAHLHHTPTDMVELVMQSLELAANSFELETGAGIERPQIEQDFAANLPLVTCSPSEIQQVILNLLRNAAQAFRVDEYGPPPDPKIILRIFQEDDFLCIEVQDNGPGMPESVARHIFEPFYTTKGVGQGTGLGLSVSYFIITEHHGGIIGVDSQPGEGTTFVIKLPIQQDRLNATADDTRHSDK